MDGFLQMCWVVQHLTSGAHILIIDIGWAKAISNSPSCQERLALENGYSPKPFLTILVCLVYRLGLSFLAVRWSIARSTTRLMFSLCSGFRHWKYPSTNARTHQKFANLQSVDLLSSLVRVVGLDKPNKTSQVDAETMALILKLLQYNLKQLVRSLSHTTDSFHDPFPADILV